MIFKRKRRWIRIHLIVFFLINSFSSIYSQNIQVEMEVNIGIHYAKNANYSQAITVLKKFAEMKGFDDFKTLEINVYLNLCYLATNNEAFKVDKVNVLIDNYLAKFGFSNNDALKIKNEMELLYYVGIINGNVGNYEKMVFYLSQVKKHYNENHSIDDQFYSSILYPLTLGYFNLSDYQSAIDVGQIALKVNNKLYGETNDASLKILDLIYNSFYNKNELNKALEFLQKRIFIGKELLGERNPDYLTSLNTLAIIYTDLGEYSKVLETHLKVLELRREALGEKHPDYFQSLSNLAYIYLKLGDYSKALELNLKATELGKEILGEKNHDYLACLNNLAVIYDHLGDYHKAIETDQIVIEIRKDILGERHPDYLTSLNNLAMVYSNLGDYRKMLEIMLEVVEKEKKELGESHPDYLSSLSNLASSYSDCGFYSKALEINLKVAEIRNKILGENHPDYFITLNNIASNYSDLGELQKALETQINVVELSKKKVGEKNPIYLGRMNNLSMIYKDLGNYPKALEIIIKVIDIQKEVLGEMHPDFLVSLSNLAGLHADLENDNKALEIEQKVVELHKEILGENHPDYLLSLQNLAVYCSNLGDHQKSLDINLKVVQQKKNVFGENHPSYIYSLSQLSLSYFYLGDIIKAKELQIKASELFKKYFGDKHPDYLMTLGYLTAIEYKLGEFNSALNNDLLRLTSLQENIVENFQFLTEFQRNQIWNKYSLEFTLYFKFLEKGLISSSNFIVFGYNVSLFSKGLLLSTSIEFDKLLSEKGTPETIKKYEDLRLLKFQIQKLLEKPITQRYLNVDSLENLAQQKETELINISKEYGDYTRNLKITWKDVQANLENNDVAIEFVEYPTLTDTVKYAALVLRKGWQYPKMISLFRKDQIEEFIKQDKDKIYSNGFVGKQIKKLIWSPLEEVISPGERIYFSPAGIIHQLAIENLPADDSTTLGDRYQMYRLSSTKELALKRPEEKNLMAVLFGGLQYDLPEEKMVAESKKYENNQNFFSIRGYSNDTTVRSGWKFLAGTKPEVDKISQLIRDRNFRVTEYTGEAGNEESFKSLSGKKTGILHIATHGFFLPVEKSKKNPFVMQRMGDQQHDRATVDPMLRSGLMMAGGNKAWMGEKIPENIEDGVLTAKEISHIDLRGTDLVVLSACETGLGEVSSEGVFGLQRSFKQAGARTLMMSLWEVNDEATRYMMTEFYTNLLSGKEKRVAFLEAKQKCKAKFPEPQYWAAFIMLD